MSEFQDDKLIRKTPVYDSDGSYVAIRNEVVITKEEFLSCYKEWVLKNPAVSIQSEFFIPVGNNGSTHV